MSSNYSKAGCENPATQQKAEIKSRQDTSKPVAAMAGSFTREFPDVKLGACGVSEPASGPSKPKQTWTGAAEGYTSREFPNYTPSISVSEHSGGKAQNVKGKDGKPAPRESAQVAGVSR